MNRRGFLKFLAPAAALIVAPEILIPRKTFFLPPAGGWRDHMTATEVLARNAAYAQFHMRAWRDSWENIINPPVMIDAGNEMLARALLPMLEDLNAYGTGYLKIEPGSVHHVPIGAMRYLT